MLTKEQILKKQQALKDAEIQKALQWLESYIEKCYHGQSIIIDSWQVNTTGIYFYAIVEAAKQLPQEWVYEIIKTDNSLRLKIS